MSEGGIDILWYPYYYLHWKSNDKCLKSALNGPNSPHPATTIYNAQFEYETNFDPREIDGKSNLQLFWSSSCFCCSL